ncbi:MAG: hypothetical protein M3203_02710 [Actinomycetota bacterium]|nr:hypothetical protein [Actinomycetota bacterium]
MGWAWPTTFSTAPFAAVSLHVGLVALAISLVLELGPAAVDPRHAAVVPAHCRVPRLRRRLGRP